MPNQLYYFAQCSGVLEDGSRCQREVAIFEENIEGFCKRCAADNEWFYGEPDPVDIYTPPGGWQRCYSPYWIEIGRQLDQQTHNRATTKRRKAA